MPNPSQFIPVDDAEGSFHPSCVDAAAHETVDWPAIVIGLAVVATCIGLLACFIR